MCSKLTPGPCIGWQRAGLADGTFEEGGHGLRVRCIREPKGSMRAKSEVGGGTVLLLCSFALVLYWLLLKILFGAACRVSKCGVFRKLERE